MTGSPATANVPLVPKLREMRPVTAEYASLGPNQRTHRQKIAKPAGVVFRILEDGPSWKEWFDLDVEWTSELPFGEGTTRTVTGRAGLCIDEYFVAWEDGRRMAFRFDRATLPVATFAEDWTVVPTSDDTSELEWSYAYEWSGLLAPVASRAFGIGFAVMGSRALRRLAAYAESTDGFD